MLAAGITLNASASVTVGDLRCEYMVDPVGINAQSPRLSWKLTSDAQNEKQTAVEIIAASCESLLTPEKADLYNSGKMETDWSNLFPYVGKHPTGMEQVFWKVRVWDKDGKPSEWSPTAKWSYGPDTEEDWKGAEWISISMDDLGLGNNILNKKEFYENAQWIWTPEAKAGQPTDVPDGKRFFAKTLTIPTGKKLKSLTGVGSADDSFKLYLNGEQGTTGGSWKDLTSFDLTKLAKTGENAIRVEANNGTKGYAALACLIVATYEDGSRDLIGTDNSWVSVDNEPIQWPNTDIKGWQKVSVIGEIGISPWGKPGENASDMPDFPALLLRKEFTLDPNKAIRTATAHITGLGIFELYLNGEKVGDHVLDAMVTDYDKTVAFQSFDITSELTKGKNAIGVQLGNGRFCKPRVGKHYGQPMTRALLRVEYTDGSIQEIVTDETWSITSQGPIRFNNEFDGETYDARMELPGWSTTGFAANNWYTAKQLSKSSVPTGKVKAQMMPPIRVTEVLNPLSVKLTQRGTYMVDMGQNMVGWCRIKAKGLPGTTIKLVHAETLKPDGTLYMDNLRSAKVTDTYIMKGKGTEVYEPRFIYHGFRFVEITGYPGALTADDIQGCVVHDDLDIIGHFETSNPLVNQIYHNIFWGVRGNYRSMPTDCPQRDERLGWLGDRAAESRGEGLIFNIAPLYAKWLRDMADSQEEDGSISDVSPNYWPIYKDNVTWPSASVIIPEALYDEYGDVGVVAEHYPSMKKWMDLMQTYVKDGILGEDTYGDWCCPPESPELIHSNDPLRKTACNVLSTTYFYGNLRLMEKYAKLINKHEDAKIWAQRAEEMKAAFIAKYYNKEKKCFDNGSQTSSVLPLFFGMVPNAEEEKEIFWQLVNKIMVNTKGHIGTGLVGGQYLNRVLSDNGRDDISWKLVTNTDYPSWGYMVKKGATTIWELWNGDTANPGMNSHNHVMLIGDLNIWFYERLAGIRSVQPGYKEIRIEPHPVLGVDFVKASIETPYGKVESHWKLEGKKFILNVEIPANTTATIAFPNNETKKVGSGKYTFTVEDAFPLIAKAGIDISGWNGKGEQAFNHNTLTAFGPFTVDFKAQNGKFVGEMNIPYRSEAVVGLPGGKQETFTEGKYHFEQPLK